MLTSTCDAQEPVFLRLRSLHARSPQLSAVAGLGRRLSPLGFVSAAQKARWGFVWDLYTVASLRSPLFCGRASSRVGVPHRRWPCTQAATGQPLPDSSAHDPPAHPSEQRRLRLRVQKYTGPSPEPSRAAFFEAKKSVSLPRVGQTLDCGSWAEEFFFCPQAVRPVCVAGLLHA